MIEESMGVRVGHWTDPTGRTGCTVVVFEPGCTASGEVRGGAPATRDFALLHPARHVQHVDAVVLSGGSAFGLAAADGVMDWLAEAGRGFATRVRPVPIVVGMSLFDLADDLVPPDGVGGRAAAESASTEFVVGPVGAGAGATWNKWRGGELSSPAGLGYYSMTHDDVIVSALVAVNAVGELDDGTLISELDAGTFTLPEPAEESLENTTIGVIWTNANLDKTACRLVAESGHNGLARALIPAHTSSDGDALVAVSAGEVEAPLRIVRLLATLAVERAIRSLADSSV